MLQQYQDSTPPPNLLLIVQIGSRLHGTATETSDYDYLIVNDAIKKSKHTIFKNIDLKEYNLTDFLRYAYQGSPHILEAMFAPDEFIIYESELMSHIRPNFRVGIGPASHAYEKSIASYERMGTAKAYKHIDRLINNLYEIGRTGRFNPHNPNPQGHHEHT